MTENFALAAFRFSNMSLGGRILRSVLAPVLGGVVWLWLAIPGFAGELRLLMFDQPGCVYCAQWDAEIGPIYPKTQEAELAPLLRVGIRDALPDGVELDRPATFTPTFVLVDEGREVGRIEGYPGEDFFWFLLGELIAGAGAPDA